MKLSILFSLLLSACAIPYRYYDTFNDISAYQCYKLNDKGREFAMGIFNITNNSVNLIMVDLTTRETIIVPKELEIVENDLRKYNGKLVDCSTVL